MSAFKNDGGATNAPTPNPQNSFKDTAEIGSPQGSCITSRYPEYDDVPIHHPYRLVDLSRFITPAVRSHALRQARTHFLHGLRAAEMAMDGETGRVPFNLHGNLQALMNHAGWTFDELEAIVEQIAQEAESKDGNDMPAASSARGKGAQ